MKPIKATFKFDNTGLGHDSATDFNNHWWERVYNDAAQNVTVSKSGTTIQTNEEDAVDISTSSINFKKLKKKHGKSSAGFGGSFIKTATLTNLGREDAIDEKVDLEEFRHTTVKPLTDEELFAACGGRTAHKGARHGLKLSGKLARLAEQDALMLEKFSVPSTSVATSTSKPVDGEDAELKEILHQAEYSKKLSRQKKQRRNRIDTELSESLDSFSLQSPTKEVEEQAFHRLNNQQAGGIKKKKRSTKVKQKLSKMVDNFLEEFRGSKSDEEPAPAEKKSKKGLKKYKSDEELNVVQKKEERKKKKKRSDAPQVYIEASTSQMSVDLEADTDVTELEDSVLEKYSPKKKRLSKDMKPKRKRNRDAKLEKKLAKALSATLSVDQEEEDMDEEL